MAFTISILIFLASILLIGVVLIQKSKGGGLAASASNYNQFMGVRKTTDFVEKATWGLAIFICVLSIASAFISKPTMVQGTSLKSLNTAPANNQNEKATDYATNAANQGGQAQGQGQGDAQQ